MMNAEAPASEALPVPARSRWSDRILVVLFVAVVLPVGTSVLYLYSPSEHSFFPPCIFYWLTGLHCPGCGATRCVHALLHLDFPQAFAYNPLFVLVAPLLAYSAVCTLYTMWTGKHVPGFRMPLWAVILIVVSVFAYGIMRNIPAYPFELLAPHKL